MCYKPVRYGLHFLQKEKVKRRSFLKIPWLKAPPVWRDPVSFNRQMDSDTDSNTLSFFGSLKVEWIWCRFHVLLEVSIALESQWSQSRPEVSGRSNAVSVMTWLLTTQSRPDSAWHEDSRALWPWGRTVIYTEKKCNLHQMDVRYLEAGVWGGNTVFTEHFLPPVQCLMWIWVTRLDNFWIIASVQSQLPTSGISVKNYSEFGWSFSVSIGIEWPKLQSTIVFRFDDITRPKITQTQNIITSQSPPAPGRPRGRDSDSKFKCLRLITRSGLTLWQLVVRVSGEQGTENWQQKIRQKDKNQVKNSDIRKKLGKIWA